MIPATVNFTGLSFDPMAVLNGRFLIGVIPSAWHRLSFTVPRGENIDKVNRWVHTNMNGRYTSYGVHNGGDTIIFVAFEELNDAVLFRLKGGETACMTDFKNDDT